MKEDTTRLELTDDFLLDAAENRFSEENYLGALTLLNKREELHGPLADGYALAADVYEALELWQCAEDAWFRFLDVCNEADFSEGFEGLAVCFMNEGNEMQSAYYYHRAFFDGDGVEPDEIEFPAPEPPRLRLVHVEGEPDTDPETIAEGFAQLKAGELAKAKETFRRIDETNADYGTAAGLAAMCTLMSGDEEGAARECLAAMEKFPDNIQLLTTYCAVLGAKQDRAGAREIGRKLASLPATSVDDLYRIATALCETELHGEAYEKLALLLERLPYDDTILWFYAVAAQKVQKTEDAIAALETLTTIYPRKAVARWYLEHLRMLRDGDVDRVGVNYFYRLPEEEYSRLASYFLQTGEIEGDEALDAVAVSEEFAENFRLAFDEMEGRDEKLQMLAAKVAVRSGADELVREVLLDHGGNEGVKLAILRDLTMRNTEESYGVVICNIYKEFYTHKLALGQRKQFLFLQAFADVYSKYALIGEEHENKLCAAAEEVYEALANADCWNLFVERAALSAAIYREARLKHGERKFSEICKMFDADETVAKDILNLLV